MNVLLVEDDPAHVVAIQRILKASNADIQVRLVGTLAAFHQAVAVAVPDIALVDLNLPDGNAIDILNVPPDKHPFPVVVMTSYGNEQIAVEAMKAGALDYIVKSAEAFAGMPRSLERVCREWNLLMERQEAAAVQKRLIVELEDALAKVNTLSGLLPICAGCKKIRDDQGYWGQVETYIQDHSEVQFTHSLCPDCVKKYYPETKEAE